MVLISAFWYISIIPIVAFEIYCTLKPSFKSLFNGDARDYEIMRLKQSFQNISSYAHSNSFIETGPDGREVMILLQKVDSLVVLV
jgi:hypothetical protein